jgi:hypothetical protein
MLMKCLVGEMFKRRKKTFEWRKDKIQTHFEIEFEFCEMTSLYHKFGGLSGYYFEALLVTF